MTIITKNGEDELISINLPNVTGVGGKTTGSGYGTTAIQTEYTGSNNLIIHGATQISIKSSYINAWNIYLNWLFRKSLDPSDYSIVVLNDEAIVQFFNSPDIDFTMFNINAQIGAGWVE